MLKSMTLALVGAALLATPVMAGKLTLQELLQEDTPCRGVTPERVIHAVDHYRKSLRANIELLMVERQVQKNNPYSRGGSDVYHPQRVDYDKTWMLAAKRSAELRLELEQCRSGLDPARMDEALRASHFFERFIEPTPFNLNKIYPGG